jgi:aryl-alcohol dehydrogenase-like predicted oxidoreductase
MNRYCAATGVGLIPWSPLYRGHLARPLTASPTTRSSQTPVSGGLSDADREIIKRVEELAGRKGWPMVQVALAWVIKKGAVPIVGFSGVERMMQAVEVKGKSLTDDEMRYLEEKYVPKNIVGHA